MGDQLNLFSDDPNNSGPVDPGKQILAPIPLDKDRLRTAVELVPPDALYYLTQTYDIDSNLLGRLLRASRENQIPGIKLTRKKIASLLTVPTKQIVGLTASAIKAELILSNNMLTPFGKVVLNADPHLLNSGLLWFLHYLMASNANLVLWSRLFNTIYYQAEIVTTSDFITHFTDFKTSMREQQFHDRGASELRSILQTYSNSLFKPLGLVVRFEERKYAVITDEFSIPPSIWLASILAYRDRYYPGTGTLETHLLVDAHFSPGRLFRQNEKQVRQALDRMHSLGLITVERGLGLDQVRFKSEFTWLSAVARHLQEER